MSSRLKRKLILDYVSYIFGWGLAVLQGVLTIMLTENEWFIGVGIIIIAVLFIISHTKYMYYIAVGNVSVALSHCADKQTHGG